MSKLVVFVVVGGVLVAGALGGVALVLTQTSAGEKLGKLMNPGEAATQVRLATVRRGSITRTVSAPGMVEPRTKVEISAQVSARITALPFEEGDRVSPGDVVVRLDAQDLMARLEAAKGALLVREAQLRGAEADLALAMSDLGRKRELYDTGDIPKSEFEQSENAHNQAVSRSEAARADVEIAKAQIIEAERDVSNTVISSPINGVVTTLNAEVGELVVVGTLNTPGSVIIEVANLGDMLLEARLDESSVAQVREGQSATVYVNAYREEPFKGVVERVGLERKQWTDGSDYFEAEIRLEEEEARPLLSGMTATCEIAVQELTDVLVVPSQAVMDRRVDELPAEVTDGAAIDKRKTFAQVVYRVVNGKALATPVKTGVSDLSDTVVLAGLGEGDPVISGPFKILQTLKHEAVVEEEKAVEAAPAPDATADKSSDAADAGS